MFWRRWVLVVILKHARGKKPSQAGQGDGIHLESIDIEKAKRSDTVAGVNLEWPKVSTEWYNDAASYTKVWREAKAPEMIVVDVGRQLFVDDFMIEASGSRDWIRRYHKAKVKSLHILKADKEWERRGVGNTARPFGAGVRYDPDTKRILLWYRCGWRAHESGNTCAAISHDGLSFHKPSLNPENSNVVLRSRQVEACEIEYDHKNNIYRALRMEYMTHGKHYGPYKEYASKDGIAWYRMPLFQHPSMHDVLPLLSYGNMKPFFMADRSSFFYNPLRTIPVWTLSLRENICRGGPSGHMRIRRYAETPVAAHVDTSQKIHFNALKPYLSSTVNHSSSYFQCRDYAKYEPRPWLWPDATDCQINTCDLYAVDAIGYESILMFSLSFLHAPYIGGELKNNSIHIGFSRDGFHVSRPKDRRPFITPPSHISNLQLATGSPLIVGKSSHNELLYFYFGFGTKANFSLQNISSNTINLNPSIHRDYDEGTGLATLRRDGFASIEPKSTSAYLITKPLLFFEPKRYLFLNLILGTKASITIQFLHSSHLDSALLVNSSSTRKSFVLTGPIDSTSFLLPHLILSPALQARPFRLRFYFDRKDSSIPAKLFAFWFSFSSRGSSNGFLAGGSLRTESLVDNVIVTTKSKRKPLHHQRQHHDEDSKNDSLHSLSSSRRRHRRRRRRKKKDTD